MWGRESRRNRQILCTKYILLESCKYTFELEHDTKIMTTVMWQVPASITTIQAVSRRLLTAKTAVSMPCQSMWDLRRTKWHCDVFFSGYLNFLLPALFHKWYIRIQSSIADAVQSYRLKWSLKTHFSTIKILLKINKWGFPFVIATELNQARNAFREVCYTLK